MLICTNNAWQSAAAPDTEYELFGGGVHGKYISLTPGKEIKQTWALQSPTWPDGKLVSFGWVERRLMPALGFV
jgi:activator of HSP90 ATPase